MTSPGLLDRVRAACARVAAEAEQVVVAGDLVAYARTLIAAEAPVEAYDRAHHFFSDDAAALAAYIVILDAVNFGSGYFPHLLKRPGMSGYFTVASSLRDVFASGGAPTAHGLSRLGAAEVAALFGQDLLHPLRAELMELFARALRDLGRFLLERHRGSVVHLIEAAGGSAERLVSELLAMPLYRDVGRYRGREVPFYKRAQITASDLALAFEGASLGRFDDLDRLTIFADNLVPHVLWCDGLLQLSPRLAARIARGGEIAAGSRAEIELRAVALDAVERMVAGVRPSGGRTTARQFDLLLWNRGQAQRYRDAPRQRTRTPYY